ncbi:MAG: hypothetical protein ACK5TH_11830 [Prosthecobacter sp.]|jgi:hypothetical protein
MRIWHYCGLAAALTLSASLASEPPRILGTAQIGGKFLAYLLPPGSSLPLQLVEGESASPEAWQILEVRRSPQLEPLQLHIQHGSERHWLAVSGGAVTAPSGGHHLTAPAISQPLIDIPASPSGPLHDQALHRSRIKNKPVARAAHRSPSDLDPFPTKLARPSRR